MLMTRAVAPMLLALALATGPAHAQPKPAQPSPTHIAVARDVAINSGMTRSFDAILPQFGERIRQSAVARPELTKDLDDVLEKLKPELEMQKQLMVTTAAQTLARNLSEPELKEIATFFKSSAGKRWVDTQPQVLDEMVREMQTWTDTVSEYVMVRVRSEMAKRGHAMQ